jgi:hypothetical protein
MIMEGVAAAGAVRAAMMTVICWRRSRPGGTWLKRKSR